MKILLTNHAMVNLGGTEVWTSLMTRKLREKGHTVHIFTLLKGDVSDQLEQEGVRVFTNPLEIGDYDLVLANHHTTQRFLGRSNCPRIYTQHGPTHQLEQAYQLGASAYVGVSEEVVATLAAKGKTGVLIRNGVDLKEFRPYLTNHPKPLVLSMCKNIPGHENVKAACEELGYDFDFVHWETNPTFDVASKMREADIVVGYGRGVYEALACGKEVLVYGMSYRGNKEREPLADGWVTAQNIEYLVQFNCSGRGNSLGWNHKELVEALADPPSPTGWGRLWASENHDIDAVVDKYLTLTQG